MGMRDYIMPDEVQSASAAAAGMLEVVTQTSHFWLKQFFAAAIPFLIGGWLGCWIERIISEAEIEFFRSVMVAVMTLASVLAGFIVTLMLFTGRSTGAESLRVDDVGDYVLKVKYLLFSQVYTLIVHLLVVVGCVFWMVADLASSEWFWPRVALSLTSGLFLLSLIRTLLLPFQIYEIHEFELDSVLLEKQRQAQKELDAEL